MEVRDGTERRPAPTGDGMGSEGVRAIKRAIDLLLLLTRGPQSLTALASAAGLSKATTHRVLQSLQHRHVVSQDHETSLYALGAGCLPGSTTTASYAT